MEIKKVFNNNVALTSNESNQEVVVMGKGLAFQKKPGDTIDTDKIEKTFILQDKETSEKLNQLLSGVSEKYLGIVSEILDYAKSKLPYSLNEFLYIALTDHIDYAITRHREGISLKNTLSYEIRKYYKAEYQIGLEALDLIEQHTGIRLEEDEAASIALHLVNGGFSEENMTNAIQVTEIVNNIINIVKYHYQMELDDTSINYERFLTHLRFFAIRYIRQEKTEDTVDDFFYEQIKQKYHIAFDCAKKIEIYLRETFNWNISRDEEIYLTVHISRVTRRQANVDKSRD